MWDRQSTRNWIAQLEHRLEDIEYYLRRTIEWCDRNDVYSEQTIFACTVMTAVWVSHMRGEPISKHELFEILGVKDWDQVDDAVYEFNSEFESLEHEELLEMVARTF